MSGLQDEIHEWMLLVQPHSYRYPNCWGTRVGQFWEKFARETVEPDLLIAGARAHPDLLGYQVLAEDCTSTPFDRLEFAKKAFWHSPFDIHIQDRFYAAAYQWSTGREAPPEDRTLSFVCSRPFETLEIGGGGGVHSCCSAWLAETTGWLQSHSLSDIWNNDVIARHRSQVANRDYKSCSTLMCGYFHDKARGVERRFPLYEPIDPQLDVTRVPEHPVSLHLCNDSSCNLSCPSCRTGKIMANRTEFERQENFFLPQIMSELPHLKRLWVTGSGDPFASRHYRNLMNTLKQEPYRHIKIDMQTNGVLFNEREWDRFDFDGRLGVVIVSIDAGRPETYAKVRLGGNWARLMDNLAFLGRKRQEGHIERLRLDIVTQTCNFREIPDVADLVDKVGADQAYFSVLTNWGHMSWDEFCSAFVFSPDHPEFNDFVQLYCQMRTDPRIDWGNIPRWALTSSSMTH